MSWVKTPADIMMCLLGLVCSVQLMSGVEVRDVPQSEVVAPRSGGGMEVLPILDHID